jgi:hypothetical protein
MKLRLCIESVILWRENREAQAGSRSMLVWRSPILRRRLTGIGGRASLRRIEVLTGYPTDKG